MDDLLGAYRKASHEAPSPIVDARILRAADNAASSRRWYRRAMWPAAMAASVLLWAGTHVSFDRPAPAGHAMAGYDAGVARIELLRMDVTPPPSDVDRFLLNVTSEPLQHTTRNAP
ncbi:hypothetical protein [Dyella sp. C11]|uniref:hypothetical protein n=1 Tax=Dyella sp. C11 TaxID=2126991 RepID=UPI0013007D55|nr:hypothetical protein [Dyella sp. C11]